MPEFSYYIIIRLICLMYGSFLEDLSPNETYYVENIKTTNFILGTNRKSTNIRIHELVIINQITKIDAHKEKYFHSISKARSAKGLLTPIFKASCLRLDIITFLL